MGSNQEERSTARRRWSRRPRFRPAALVVPLAAMALVVVPASPATAATSIATEALVVADIIVGQTVPATVHVINTSTTDATDTVSLDTITLIPSCANLDVNCSGGAQPGVFSIGPTATGESNTACAGRTFDITLVDPSTGKRAFTPDAGPIVLGPRASATAECRIDLEFEAVTMPTLDSNAALPGVQTNSIAYAHGTRGGDRAGSASASGSDQATLRAAPTLGTAASQPALVGDQIHDTATLSGGFDPTGTIVFDLFGPDNATCTGTPVFHSVVDVNGNGDYKSGETTVTQSGTYRWTASYTGDIANLDFPGSCNAAGETTQVRSRVAPPADFDGDGHTDLAVFRPASSEWLVRGISDTVWGQAGDVPVPGDYDRDGIIDLAVWRPDTGQWLVRGISDTVWGQAGDVPVPGDYDGDARTDLGVWRPGSGTWLVRGLLVTQYGAIGDVPLPLPAAISQAAA